ncbi:MAG TPA: citrate synthase/methylcitrate synthase [Thermoanaerobaculia bacterium]|nr:citrate synthase/methylcitrate synthase [Thermoanaerobaculia bacterium]
MSTATAEARSTPVPTAPRGGLEGVVAATTRLSHVEGEAGRLTLAGHPLAEIAPHASCEEMAFLLWEDRLPKPDELAELRRELVVHRTLPPAVLDLLRAAAGADPMDALRMGVAALDAGTDSKPAERTPRGDAVRLLAAVPSIVAAHHRLAAGLEPVAPRDDLDHAAAYLHQLTGAVPAPERTRALATYLNTVSDHGLNASTFTARVIVSTGSDLVSAVAGAVGALKGPLHGGAPGPALDTVLEIGDASRAETVLRQKLERGERLMGFGHRVYRVRDPRADVLAAAAERLFENGGGDRGLYRLALAVEQVALRLLREHKPDRRLDTNVEFYTALLLHGLGLPAELFTPTFAVGRTAGWTAHALEQAATGRLIRPAAEYSGTDDRRWVPVEERDGRRL